MTRGPELPGAGATLRAHGRMPDGRPVQEVTLSDGTGLVLKAITLGGIVTMLAVPGRDGRLANVVCCLDGLDDYARHNPYFGIIVGRYANRIAGGELTIDGTTHALARNDRGNCLHGGEHGFGTRVWDVESVRQHDAALGGPAVTLRYVSADGEQGFPGRVDARVTYSVGADSSWRIDYEATTDQPTVVNLSHHDYFNLAGAGSALDHLLMLPASRYNPVDERLIPTGIAGVEGTPFDFRVATPIGRRLGDDHAQLRVAGGYDHNWIVDAPADDGPRVVARLADPGSGRTMTMFSTEPAIQFYSGNFLDPSLPGTGGRYARGSGICLETQHSPDSPHHPDWPSTLLRPGAVYRSCTLHRFAIEESLPGQS